MKISEKLHLPVAMAGNRQDAVVNSFGVQVAQCSSLDYVEPIVRAANAHDDMLTALRSAESFISGFEGDEVQEGIDELLAGIRGAIAKAEGR